MSSPSPRPRDITINTTGAPTASALAAILGAHHHPGMILFYENSSLVTQITFRERSADGERRVTLQVLHAQTVYDGGYCDRSIDDDGVHKAEVDSNRPEVKRLIERLGCPEKLPKIQVSKETIETIDEEEEDEDNSSTTRKRSATRSSFTWATTKGGGHDRGHREGSAEWCASPGGDGLPGGAGGVSDRCGGVGRIPLARGLPLPRADLDRLISRRSRGQQERRPYKGRLSCSLAIHHALPEVPVDIKFLYPLAGRKP